MRSTIRPTTALLVVAGISLAADTTKCEAASDPVMDAASECNDDLACIYFPEPNICYCPYG